MVDFYIFRGITGNKINASNYTFKPCLVFNENLYLCLISLRSKITNITKENQGKFKTDSPLTNVKSKAQSYQTYGKQLLFT